MTRASLSDCLVSYTGHLLGESYSFAGMQSVYSTVPADWAKKFLIEIILIDKCTISCVLKPQINLGTKSLNKLQIEIQSHETSISRIE